VIVHTLHLTQLSTGSAYVRDIFSLSALIALWERWDECPMTMLLQLHATAENRIAGSRQVQQVIAWHTSVKSMMLFCSLASLPSPAAGGSGISKMAAATCSASAEGGPDESGWPTGSLAVLLSDEADGCAAETGSCCCSS